MMKFFRLEACFCALFIFFFVLFFDNMQVIFAQSATEYRGIIPAPDGTVGNSGEDLGERIQDGTVALRDVPLIVIYLINLATKLAGTIAVGFIIYAGFQLMIGGVTDDRESAKNTLKYAVTGLVVAFLAWITVNLIQVQLTSGVAS